METPIFFHALPPVPLLRPPLLALRMRKGKVTRNCDEPVVTDHLYNCSITVTGVTVNDIVTNLEVPDRHASMNLPKVNVMAP